MNIWIKGITAIPVTQPGLILDNTNIYITDDKILHIGEALSDFVAELVIDGAGKLAIPGLINMHTHLGMSLLRNYTDDLDLMTWLTEAIWPFEARLNREDIYYGSLLSMIESIRAGVTCFNDMYFEMDRVGDAALEIGMRGALSSGFIEDERVEERLEGIETLHREYHGKGGLLQVFVAPHAPYTVGPNALVRLRDLAEKLETRIHIHLSETRGEVDRAYESWGKSPIAHVASLGLFELPTIAAHCVHVDEEDIRIMSEQGVFVAHNPSSNLKLASGFAPIQKMLDSGVQVSLGTDGSSSNNNVNMVEELHLASLLAKGVSLDPKALNAYQALEMATASGAAALGMGDRLGRLKEGYLADITILDMAKPHHCPRNHPISALVYSMQASDVETVIIAGKPVMKEGTITSIDEEEVMGEVQKRVERLKSEG